MPEWTNVNIFALEKNKKVKAEVLKIKVYMLFFIFAMYWAGCTLCFHKHTVDGVTIVHSHPFSDSTHKHKSGDLKWIDMLSHICVEEMNVCDVVIGNPSAFSLPLIVLQTADVLLPEAEGSVSLRAPPVA